MAAFREAFLGKRFICCALTIVYSIYNTVGRSIASIYDLGGISTSLQVLQVYHTGRSKATATGTAGVPYRPL